MKKEHEKEHKGMGKKESGFGAHLGKMKKGKGGIEGPHGKEMGRK
jgi:hypothetical protein